MPNAFSPASKIVIDLEFPLSPKSPLSILTMDHCKIRTQVTYFQPTSQSKHFHSKREEWGRPRKDWSKARLKLCRVCSMCLIVASHFSSSLVWLCTSTPLQLWHTVPLTWVAPLGACSLAQWMSHLSGISNILGSPPQFRHYLPSQPTNELCAGIPILLHIACLWWHLGTLIQVSMTLKLFFNSHIEDIKFSWQIRIVAWPLRLQP